MSADSLAKVEAAQQAVLKKTHGGKAGAQFVQEVKESLLFQYNWNELLSAAPTAITLVGACHVAAASPEAAAISLADAVPAGGFKYLRVAAKPTLRACLVFIAGEGDKAFRIAGSNMSAIAGTSSELIETVTRTVKAIQGLPDTQRNLTNELVKLRRMSNNCLSYAQDTEKAFDTWLLAVSEFHQASVQKHGTTEQESQDNLSAKLQAEIEASYTNKELEKADQASEEMKKSLAKQEKAFQAANDAVPSAWETCAMGALTAITSAGPSLVAQALPAIINAANPMSAVNGVVSGLAQVGRQGALNAPGAPPIAQALLGGQQGAQPGAATLQFNDATPETDPAYVAAPLLAPFMTTLLTYLTAGEGNTPDWSKFKDQASKNGAGTEGLTWLLSNLQMQQRSAKLGTGAPSTELAAAFDSSIAIVEEIKKEVANQQKLSSAKTNPASIKKWQDAITKAKLTVTKLEATAKSFPGSSSNAPKLNNISVDKKDNSAVTAALNTATEKLALNQKALETAQANYTNAVAAAAEVQKRLTGIQTKLKGIEIAGAALERVKEILIECIAILVELKVQISKLTTFFNALSTMVKVIIETKVKNFDTDVTAIGQEASQRGMLKLNDLDIETIYISTLQIKAYFDLLQMICQMYTNVHAKYVNPGLDLLTELSKVTKTAEEIAPKRDQLNDFTDAANKAINELVAQKQQEISDGLQSRIDAIAEQTDILHKVGVPMPAAGIIQAMRTGGEVIKDAVKDNLPSGMRVEQNVDAASDF
ncbi:hypothetical protein CaCOL14_002178 [Colletotrichum acutatum]|uniref:Uncharacterized protein n=1 Tax=Glomerella acutata TaxID=27357 RepID=A0AAD8UET5_GLOAC|nr:uncharacterized protein BDZ83DRAFT_631694 [Colletotrichum acutatum]KAK1720156.1 hypothetical protein BDZ83DRAFT_631694 [Colletotrichum acutatum]